MESTQGARTAILADRPVQRVKVECPEWDCHVWVQQPTNQQQDAWEGQCSSQANADGVVENFFGLKARLLVICVCDKDGELLFEENDWVALMQQPSAVINRLWRAAQKLAGLSAEDVKEITGNSGGESGADTGSDSPATSECPSPDASKKSAPKSFTNG